MDKFKTIDEQNKAYLEMYDAFIKAAKKFEQPKFNKKVSYGRTNFEYADLAEIIRCVRMPLLENGFSIEHDFFIRNDNQYIKTYLQYKNGLVKGNCEFPISTNNKTMQEIGGQITYLKRYSISSICGITAESDNDCQEMKDQKLNETINNKEAEQIQKLINGNTVLWKKLKLKFNCSKITDIPKNKFNNIITWLTINNTMEEL